MITGDVPKMGWGLVGRIGLVLMKSIVLPQSVLSIEIDQLLKPEF